MRRGPDKRFVVAVLALLLSAVLLLQPVLWHLKALAVLKAVGGQPVPTWLRLLATEHNTKQELTLQTEAGRIRARLYTPVRHPRAPGMVVFHGSTTSASTSRGFRRSRQPSRQVA